MLSIFDTKFNTCTSLSDSLSPQVTRNFLNILADLNVSWILPSITNYSNFLFKPLGNLQVNPLKFASLSPLCYTAFFCFLARSKYLSIFSLSFYSFYFRSCKIHLITNSFFLLINSKSGLLGKIVQFVSISKPPKILCV